jgi:SAM-dependent methyltransferase
VAAGGAQPRGGAAAEISGDAHAGRGWKAYASLNYPEFDLCAPLGDAATYDVVICEQVIEHVPDPWAAAANLRRLCAPGGHVIVSTPFLIRVHELPLYGMRDYWRFTPRGLRELLERAGLEVDGVGAWGNRECIAGNLDRWPAYRRWHPLHNEPDAPVQVWAFARNPA